MEILALADAEESYLYEYFNPARTKGVELIISCGDLKAKYLEFLQTVVNVPVLYVTGNHDTRYREHTPEGCISIEDTVYEYKGIRIAGLGGSYRYKPEKPPFMYTEAQMAKRVKKLTRRRFRPYGGIDILVTHAPCDGYGDMDDIPHWGFECFNTLLEQEKPDLMLYGHVHKEYEGFRRELDHPSGTRLINCYGSYRFSIEPKPVERTDFQNWRISMIRRMDEQRRQRKHVSENMDGNRPWIY